MSKLPDLTGLSAAELLNLVDTAEKELKAKKKETLNDVVAEIQGLVIDNGLELDDVVAKLSKSKRVSTASIKYRDPDNPTNTWKGRGKRPAWLNEKLDAGSELDDFLI